jgi:hypothetical protein
MVLGVAVASLTAGRGRPHHACVRRWRVRCTRHRGVRHGGCSTHRSVDTRCRRTPTRDGSWRCLQRAGEIVGERPQTAQVAEVGTVAGGEDDRVHHLACAIGPDDLLAVQRGEHRAWVGPSPFESDSVAAGVGDERVWDELSEPVGRQVVEAGPVQPVVQISPVDPLGKEPDGTTGCHGDPGDLGELIADLHR